MPDVGDILGEKYELTRLIGKGGMGVVFEAQHLELGKKVAIKVPNEALAKDEVELERFKREPKVAAATGHNGIIDIYDIGTCDDGLPFVVMELLDGQSLSRLISDQKRLEIEESVYIAAQVLSALDAAHGKRIVHRDLKPDNVFLVEEGQAYPSVKLLDFGTSKVVGGADAAEKLTDSGAILGTPFYMAPEQITKKVELDKRADVYAVGVLLYEMLTGKLPFEADNVYTLVHDVLDGEYTPPRELHPELPEALEAIIVRAMAHDREDRFSSAAAMLHALAPFMDDVARGRVSFPEGMRPSGAGDRRSTTEATAETLRAPSTPERDTAMSMSKVITPTYLVRRRRRVNGVIIGVVAFLLVGLTVAWTIMPGSDIDPPPAANDRTPLTVRVADPLVTKAGQEPPSQTTANVPDLVTLTLTNVPEGAVVLLDDARLRKSSVRLRSSLEAHRLEVRLENRPDHSEMITLEGDTEIDVGELVGHSTTRIKASLVKTKRVSSRPAEPSAVDGGTEHTEEAQTNKQPSGDLIPWREKVPSGM